MVVKAQVIQAIENVLDPALERSLVELGMIEDVIIDGPQATIYFAPDTLACPLLGGMMQELEQAALRVDGIENVVVQLVEAGEGKEFDRGDLPSGQIEHLNHAKRVIAVMSGKGGVGKSLVAGLLANIAGTAVGNLIFFALPLIPFLLTLFVSALSGAIGGLLAWELLSALRKHGIGGRIDAKPA
jgi:metal-sulfur cluster biosynthetic enzyme